MYDFVRVAAAVPEITVADTEANTVAIIEKVKEAAEEKADIAVFPELCVTGYTCADLFFQKSLQKSAEYAIARICRETSQLNILLIIGTPAVINGQLYNCAAVIQNGKVLGIVPKTFIPNFNEFYEKRWFSSSRDLNVDNISAKELGLLGNYEIPVSGNIIFNLSGEVRFGIEICEDIWAPIPPSSFLALNGAELIFNISASNETIAKRDYRRQVAAQQSAAGICAYVYTSSGTGESTTDLVFSGHTVIAENGTIIAENQKMTDGNYLWVQDIDIGKIKADRIKNKTFSDCASLYGNFEPYKIIDISAGDMKGDGKKYKVNKLPFVPSSKNDRIKRCQDIFELQISGLLKRLSHTSMRPVVGVSGGLDSTLALLVAAEAVKRLDRPAADVAGITMPCFGTTGRTYQNSIKLMQSLGVEYKEIDIKKACLAHFDDIGHDKENLDVTYENAQARERTQVLMDYAGEIGGLVVGTGDLSELALGWCTYNADHMSMYGVNAGVPKTLVRWMIDSIIEYDIFPDSTEVLRSILDTPISPELLPPDAEGKIAQKTEDIIGPYALHDFFLYYIIRYGFEPSKVYHLAKYAFAEDFDGRTILKWLKNFYKRFFSQQFKRSCLPDGVKIGSICLSPRGDWRMPSDASAALWLREAEKLK